MPRRKKRRKASERTLEKRRATRFIGRVVRFLSRRHTWKVSYAKMHGRASRVCRVLNEDAALDGYIWPPWEVILIDHRSQVISTLVHEVLHALYGKKPEREILRLEKMVMRHMTAKEATTIHRLMTKRLK